MGDEIRFVKNIPDAIEKIRVLRAAGFDMFPEVDQIIWEVENDPEHPTWRLERFLFKNEQILTEALLLPGENPQGKRGKPLLSPAFGSRA